jgi:oligoribonuclease
MSEEGAAKPRRLIWLDLETTGLDPRHNATLEIAAFVADFERPFELRHLYSAVLWNHDPTTQVMSIVDPFVQEMHTKNGLWKECVQSKLFNCDVDEVICLLLSDEFEYILAGSSIHFDHEFIKVDFPKFAAKLSHRHYDVSALKLFAQSLGMPPFPKDEAAHRAAADVMESVEHAKVVHKWLYEEPARDQLFTFLD